MTLLVRLLIGAGLALTVLGGASAATMSDPEVDRYNVRVGTQTFSPLYHFTTNSELVETAQAIRDMGSDVIKFDLGPGVSGQYNISVPSSITNLLSQAKNEPSCRYVLDMPFRHYVLWTYSYTGGWWYDGYTSSERQKEYNEIYGFARYLLTNYNNSGKSFYLGHWEGDGYLLPGLDTSTNPSPVSIQGMIDWLNTRQLAVDDARRATTHTNVEVFLYAEANRVRDAMVNGTNNNQRVINAVVPYVTNLDCLSWSSYDGQNLSTSDLDATLSYMESKLPTNKTASISGKRIWIGEYGWGGSYSSAEQEPRSRAYWQRLIPWGVRFILFWEMYNNETNHQYWLIDNTGAKTPCYFLHQRFINQARLGVAQFKESNARLPTDAEFSSLVTPMLDQPLPAPVSFVLANAGVTNITTNSATVSGMLTQGVYGEDWAAVWVYWGPSDGGTVRGNWQNRALVAVNSRFNTASYTAVLTNLAPRADTFFRFYGTNSSGEAWVPSATRLSTDLLEPGDFTRSMRINFSGYTRGEALRNFPVLVTFQTNLAGFAYGQFASPTGGDLRFTDASGTEPIFFEIDEWNTNGVSSVWVQISLLSSPNDSIWAYWGNAAATNRPAGSTNGAVWSQDYEVVWHLKENALPFADSTLRHPALAGRAPAPSASGMVGHAQVFDGATDYLNAGTIDVGALFTLSSWVKVDTNANSIQALWANKGGGYNSDGFGLFIDSYQSRDQKVLLETGNGTSGTTASTVSNVVTFGSWHHIAAVADRVGGAAHLYVDGAERTQAGAIRSDFTSQREVDLGRFTDGNFFFRGAMDEVRIATAARSSNWIWASWMTVASNAAFASYWPVQIPGRTVVPVSLIATGAVWRFFDGGLDLGTAWRSNSFDDGSWQSGPAQLGYGDNDEATIVGYGLNPSNKYITTYFRRVFFVPDAAAVQSLTARLLRDDGAVVYLNGAEVWRDNLPTGAINYLTLAPVAITGTNETNWLTHNLNPLSLLAGINQLAVEIHQDATNSSDIRFNFELSGTALLPLESPALGIAPGGGPPALSWSASAGFFSLYVATNLSPPIQWEQATNIPMPINGQWWIQPAPTDQPARFYRLQSP